MDRTAEPRSRPLAAVALALSFGLHGVAYAMIDGDGRPERRVQEPVEFEVLAPPPPPAAPAPELPSAPEAAPSPRPVRTPKAPRPPPPSNDAPPPAPTARPVPLKVGVSLGSTTAAGSFAVGAGNTLYGKADETAADPAEVRPYVAPEKPAFVAATRVTTQPRVLRQVKPEYTPEAKAAGVEGDVILLLRIDREGQVSAVTVLKGLGHGLDAAAERAAWQLRFAPATLDGEPVATETRFTYHCLLE